MPTHSEQDFERIAAAIGKDLVHVLQYEKRFEAAAMWFRWNREGSKIKRTAPSTIKNRMEQIAKAARRLLWHLEVFNYRNATDGRGISFRSGGPSYCSAALSIDDGGNQVWSVNIVVGDEDQTYIDNSVPIFPYSKVGEPNTMFNPVPIKAAHRIADKPTKEELRERTR